MIFLLGDVNKQKKDRPPLPKTSSTPRRSTTTTAAAGPSATSSPSTSTPVRSSDTPKRNEKPRLPPSSSKKVRVSFLIYLLKWFSIVVCVPSFTI